jgi:hypothetical protein
MEDIPRITLCLPYNGVNIFDPSQLIQIYNEKVPEYIVENIRDGCNDVVGINVTLLFLEDILSRKQYNQDNHRMIRKLFPTLSDNYLLPFWDAQNLLDGPKTGKFFSPRNYVSDSRWEIEKQKLYLTQPHLYHNIRVLEKSVEIIYERVDGKKIEDMTLFNSLATTSRIPYIHHPKFTKRKSDFYVPKKWLEDKEFCIYVSEDGPNFLSPFVQVFSGTGVQSLTMTIDLDDNINKYSWLDLPNDVIQKFLVIKNVSEKDKDYFMSQLVSWKIYISNFKKFKLQIDDARLKIIINSKSGDVDSEMISNWVGAEFEELVRNTSHLEVSFEYPHVALDSNIFAQIISTTPVLCTLLLIREDRKTTHFTRDQDKFKGTMRVWAHIQKSIVKATVEQQGRSKARSQPSLKITLTAPNMVAVKEFAQLLGIAITIYQQKVNSEYSTFKKLVKDYPKPHKIETKPCNLIDCNSKTQCPKGCGECNPVSGKCSLSITTTDWWVENYSRACQQKTRMPWLVDPDTIEELRSRGYLVKEFPKGSGEFLTCKKSKGNYDWLYLSTSTLSNTHEFPYIPCCGKEDKARLNPGSEYNKYFNNLENLNLSNGVRLEINIRGKLNKKLVEKFENLAKEKDLQIIGVDENSGKLLLHDFSITPMSHKNPVGALLFSKKQKKIMIHIFLEPGHLEAEKRFYNRKNIEDDIAFDYGIGKALQHIPEITSIKMITTRVKLNDDLKHQKRALIGRRGSLPDDINRFLGLVTLKFLANNVRWKRYGVTSQPYASFLHVLYAWSANKKVSLDSDLIVKTKFASHFTPEEIYALCAQSMSDFSQEEILDKLNPNKPTYIDPRQFHAMAEIVFGVNIVLFYRRRGSSETAMTLPYSKQGYIKSDRKYNKTVLIYQHFGTEVEKHNPIPHCELIDTENGSGVDITDSRVFEYIYQSWLNSQTLFDITRKDNVIAVPKIFFQEGYTQQIGPIGKGTGLYIKDHGRTMLLSTENLPPIKIPAALDSTVVNTDGYVNEYVTQNLKAVLINQENSDSYLLSKWKLNDFTFSTVIFHEKTSPQKIFKSNEYLAKCLKGYFMYALSDYLTARGINKDVIRKRIDGIDVNCTYTLDCIYRNLIERFVRDNVIKKRDSNSRITGVIISTSYPPPMEIYHEGKLNINSGIFMESDDFDMIMARLKLSALLSMQHDLDFVSEICQMSAIPGFFQQLSDFTTKTNEVIIPAEYNYPFDSTGIIRWLNKEGILTPYGARLGQTVYETPLLDYDEDYIWRNNQLTRGQLCTARTYKKSVVNRDILTSWFARFGVSEETFDTLKVATISDTETNIPEFEDFMIINYQHNDINLIIVMARI